ncbi:septum formation initiator family protein [Candidatus Peribacteria bacterium]|nr:septum formation initiator family protein [Candidatus Peribacteria bacterium]
MAASPPQTQAQWRTGVLLALGGLVLWLLYSLSITLHQTEKIRKEIYAIEAQNEALREDILQKEQYLSYLQTPERITKEAKAQLGRMEAGEEVIVIHRQSPSYLQQATLERSPIPEEIESLRERTIPEKWRALFFG